MKLRFLSVFSVTLSILMMLIFSLSATGKVETANDSFVSSSAKVITVAEQTEKFDTSKVLESRFLNMLNHNFVYNTDFESVETIVNESVIALLNTKDSFDDSFIEESIVSDYILNMYGIEIDDFSKINTSFPQKDGYVYIIPRGYSLYEHKMVSVKENEDGSFTVKTELKTSAHDGVDSTDICETLFIVNQNSDFGYSIIYSNTANNVLAI